MNSVKSAASDTFTACCSASVGFAEIDERGRVDVDVVEAGGDLFLDQRAQRRRSPCRARGC